MTYLPQGKAIAEGQIVTLPTVADTLKNLADHGAAHFYKGDWAKKAVQLIKSVGGNLTLKDFSRYRIQWREPSTVNYRGIDLFAPSGRTYHGLTTLLALKALEKTSLGPVPHYTADSAALEKIVRAEDWAEAISGSLAFVDGGAKLDDQATVQNSISDNASFIWQQVQKQISPGQDQTNGTHSYHVVVIDSDGNAITGTNTIEALPWGQGLFVDGIALTDSAKLPYLTKPGERTLMPLSMHIGIKDSKLLFAAGAFGASLASAELQFLINALDYHLSASDSISLPRFGVPGFDLTSNPPKPSGKGRWLDPRVSSSVVNGATDLGLRFDQEGMTVNGQPHYMDTGLGSIAIIREDESIDSAIAPLDVTQPN